MKSFFISLVIVLSLSVTIATAQDTLKIDERIVNLEKRIEQLESMTSYLIVKVQDLQSKVDKHFAPADAKPATEPTKTEPSKTDGDTGLTQCKATTKKGTRCSRMVNDGSGYCWQHKR